MALSFLSFPIKPVSVLRHADRQHKMAELARPYQRANLSTRGLALFPERAQAQ